MFLRGVLTLADQRLGRVVHELADNVRTDVNISYPPASIPGQPPHKRSGGLQRAVVGSRIGAGDWAYGTHLVEPHPDGRGRANLGLWMEEGTVSMRARPFLVPVLARDGMRVAEKHFGGGG
jgi:hypothetical protein